MANKKVTDLGAITTAPLSGVMHFVDTTDATQNAAGSSFKVTKEDFLKENTAAISLNSAKTGITTGQSSAITANTVKISFDSTSSTRLANTSGTNTGDQNLAPYATLASPTFTGTVSGITKTMVGLGNVLNTDLTPEVNLNTAKVGISTVQANAITVNTSKVGYTDALVAAAPTVVANTAKIGITSSQASAITVNTAKVGYNEALVSANPNVTANTAKVGITTGQASAITANTAKVGYSDALVAAAPSVVANTAKVGITSTQASAIAVNTTNNTSITESLNQLKNSSFTEKETSSITSTLNVGFIGTNGVFNAVAGNVFRSSDFILIDRNKKLRLKNKSVDGVAPITYYSSNIQSSFISFQGSANTTNVDEITGFVYPATATYYRLSRSTSNFFNLFEITFQSNVALSLLKSSDITKNQVLFTKIDFSDSVDLGFLSTANGTLQANSNFLSTTFKPFDSLKTYVCVSDLNNNSLAYVYFYDVAFSYLGFQSLTSTQNGRIRIDNGLFPTAKFYKCTSFPASSKFSVIYEVAVGFEKNKSFDDAIIIPIYGQSNALGYSANPSLTDFNKYPENLFNDSLFPLIENFTIEPNSTTFAFAETSMSASGEKVFSDILQKSTSNRTAVIALKIGQGGQPITTFIKGGSKYDSLLTAIKNAAFPYLAIGKTVRVPAFCYVQGEAEISTTTDYKGLLTQLQVDLNADIKVITGQSQDVHCCLYNLSYVNSTNATTKNTFAFSEFRVAKAQYELIRDNSKFIISTPTYGINHNLTDAIHFSNVGQRQLGVYQGDAISKLLNGVVKKGTYISAFPISTNTINLTIAVPKLPLVIDNVIVPARANQGFSVINSSDVDIISSVTVNTAAGTIAIVCSSSPVGAKLRYGNGGTVNVYGGNIRDSSGIYLSQVILGNVYQFHNFLQVCEIQL
jgi:hypothetical protein